MCTIPLLHVHGLEVLISKLCQSSLNCYINSQPKFSQFLNDTYMMIFTLHYLLNIRYLHYLHNTKIITKTEGQYISKDGLEEIWKTDTF